MTCGPGRAARQRHYIWPARALTDGCRATLTEYRHCNGPRVHCRSVLDLNIMLLGRYHNVMVLGWYRSTKRTQLRVTGRARCRRGASGRRVRAAACARAPGSTWCRAPASAATSATAPAPCSVRPYPATPDLVTS